MLESVVYGGGIQVRLNEGLPQKGKRSGPGGRVADDAAASMKGFPRRGSDGHEPAVLTGRDNASMKGFPRRGSDGTGTGTGT